jgi:hypothetical protein
MSMETSLDPIDPSSALHQSERVNPTSKSKADKEQKEFAKTLKKRMGHDDDKDEAHDVVELHAEPAQHAHDEPSQDDQQDDSDHHHNKQRHIDVKA